MQLDPYGFISVQILQVMLRYSLPFIAEAKDAWSYTASFPHIMSWYFGA
jgi:hypothetical protein